MKNRTIFLLLCLLTLASLSSGQDIHYTNYTAAPQILNPAKIGGFYGSFKVGAIARDQFANFLGQAYATQGAFVEANIDAGLNPLHWIAIGLSLNNDQTGDLALGSGRIAATASYHLPLDKKYNQIISFGLQYNYYNRRIDSNKGVAEFSEEDLLNRYNASFNDLAFGINFQSKPNKRSIFEVGSSLSHISKQKGQIPTDPNKTRDFIPLRLNVHAAFSYRKSKTISYTPRLYASTAGKATNVAVQFLTTYWLPKSEFDFGLGYRIGDALQILAGYHIKDWTVTGAFDMTISSAGPYTDNVGAFELGAFKILRKHPKAKVEVLHMCPRL